MIELRRLQSFPKSFENGFTPRQSGFRIGKCEGSRDTAKPERKGTTMKRNAILTGIQRSSMVKRVAACLGVALCLTTAFAGAADRRDFCVSNNTDRTIYKLYVSPHDAGDWQEDVLGEHVMRDGGSANISFGGSIQTCRYDFKLKFRDGSSQEYTDGTNLCAITSVQFNRHSISTD
jgi:hypothetical protein